MTASISHGWLSHLLSDDCVCSLCLHVCTLQQMSCALFRMRLFFVVSNSKVTNGKSTYCVRISSHILNTITGIAVSDVDQ